MPTWMRRERYGRGFRNAAQRNQAKHAWRPMPIGAGKKYARSREGKG